MDEGRAKVWFMAEGCAFTSSGWLDVHSRIARSLSSGGVSRRPVGLIRATGLVLFRFLRPVTVATGSRLWRAR